MLSYCTTVCQSLSAWNDDCTHFLMMMTMMMKMTTIIIRLLLLLLLLPLLLLQLPYNITMTTIKILRALQSV